VSNAIKNALSRFALSFLVTVTVLALLGWLILYEQEYASSLPIALGVSTFAGLLAALIPTSKKSIFVGIPLFIALSICYAMLASY